MKRTAALLLTLLLPTSPAAATDIVVEWNQIALSAIATAAQGPVPQTRTMAIVQVAVHDAVNAITGKFRTYAPPGAALPGANPEASAAAAAHRALMTLFPAQSAALDSTLAASLAARGLSGTDPGIAVGQAAADAILLLRATDQSAVAQFPYTAPGAGAAGVWVNTPPAFAPALLPGWGRVTPWVIASGSQFRPHTGPPDLSSRRYANEFNEVRAIGSATSATRTAEQTQIANFWLASAAVIWNGILRQVAPAKGLTLSESARVFALLNLAGADAAIACWDSKYAFNAWRPVTAIRQGDADGNDRTEGDPAWTPLVATPPFPEFVSGHTAISGAMAEVLRWAFGSKPGVPFIAVSPTSPGFVRQWTTFREGVKEVINARIYAGIHFRAADEVGAEMGREIARRVTHALGREPRR